MVSRIVVQKYNNKVLGGIVSGWNEVISGKKTGRMRNVLTGWDPEPKMTKKILFIT